MPQLFPPNANSFLRWTVIAGGIFAVLLITALTVFARTSNNQVGVPIPQPVDFSHSLHTGSLGLDCRYCHSTVETSSFATIPSTETCMTCHSQVRVGAPQLAAVQESWDSGLPIGWNRVHDMPEFVYFDHSIHVDKGVGCSSCHGQVDQMAGMWKNEPMTMGWCLECHKSPEQFLRPRSEVLNMAYERPENQIELGHELVETYHINTEKLPMCSTCHR
ncbi:MAG: cytochrome c3 family protein [Trueperaceae bacterium]